MNLVTEFSIDIIRALAQAITGRLLTERQIQSISSNLVGQFFVDWLPEPRDQREARQKVETAREHLEEATRIVSDLKTDIDREVANLEALAREVEEKRKRADEYAALIQAGEPAVKAIRAQLEASVRRELEAQSKQGRTLRVSVNLVAWLVTLVLGAALGAHWSTVESWFWNQGNTAKIQAKPLHRTGQNQSGGQAPNPAAPADQKAPLPGR